MNGDSRVQLGDRDDKQGGDSGVIEIDRRVKKGRQQGNRRVTVADRGVAGCQQGDRSLTRMRAG